MVLTALRTRRSVLRTAGALGTPMLAGCQFLGLGDDRKSGTIYIDNQHDQTHTLGVEIEKTSHDRDQTGHHGQIPDGEPVWERTYERTVDGGKGVLLTALAEPGAYFIEAREARRITQFWMGLSRSSEGGIGGEVATIIVHENGGFGFSVGGND